MSRCFSRLIHFESILADFHVILVDMKSWLGSNFHVCRDEVASFMKALVVIASSISRRIVRIVLAA